MNMSKVYYRVDESKEGNCGSSVGFGNETLVAENVDEGNLEELASAEKDNVGPTMIVSGLKEEEEAEEAAAETTRQI